MTTQTSNIIKCVLGADIQAEPMCEFEYRALMGYARQGIHNHEGYIIRFFKRHECIHTTWFPTQAFNELFVIV